MDLNQVLRWIVVAIVVTVVLVLLEGILGLIAGLFKIALPVLIVLFLTGLILRFLAQKRR
ncbi:MAG: hypothetical protein OXM02_04515 [Bacteroidota bacterium]|nr:hypothetical protein [Bacteroidota bacterium]MDE2833765.1 hypothetical protein [Bacteroidota bacterium]MDE2957805.1 hypothetical protein [Bacteroidota bacterium]